MGRKTSSQRSTSSLIPSGTGIATITSWWLTRLMLITSMLLLRMQVSLRSFGTSISPPGWTSGSMSLSRSGNITTNLSTIRSLSWTSVRSSTNYHLRTVMTILSTSTSLFPNHKEDSLTQIFKICLPAARTTSLSTPSKDQSWRSGRGLMVQPWHSTCILTLVDPS